MAALKLAVLLCVAVSCSGVQSAGLHKINTEPEQIKDAASDALKLLEKLQDIVKNAVISALNDIDGILDEVNHEAQLIIQQAETALKAAIKPFLDAIKKLEDEAAVAAVDITVCIGSSIDDISALPAHFLQNVTSCVNSKVQGIKTYVNNIVADVNSTLDVVFDLGNDIKTCEAKPILQEAICLAGVTVDITADIASLPLKITEDLAKLKLYIVKSLPSLTLCSGSVVADLGVDATQIVADVTKCAAEKINGTTIIV